MNSTDQKYNVYNFRCELVGEISERSTALALEYAKYLSMRNRLWLAPMVILKSEDTRDFRHENHLRYSEN